MLFLSLLALPIVVLAQYDYPAATPAATAAATTPKPIVVASPVAASPAASAPGAIQTVIVGGGPLVFAPSSLTVPVGGQILFQFEAKNHSVSQSTYATPCSYQAGGLNSGFVPAVAGGPYPTFLVTVTDASTPLWFYCMQGMHCASGMVFAVNAAGAQNITGFTANALNQTSVIAPLNLAGLGVKADKPASIPAGSSTAPVVAPVASSTAAGVVPVASSTKAAGSSTLVISSGLVATIFGALFLVV